MDPREADACLRILCAVAAVDGHVESVENRVLDLFSATEGGHPTHEDIDVDREARRIRSEAARRATFEAAVALANVDGQCSSEEYALLEHLQRALELETSLDIEVLEDKWSDRLRPRRAELEEADVDFLHHIERARNEEGGLTPDRYTALVAELRARRDVILHDALHSVFPMQAT